MVQELADGNVKLVLSCKVKIYGKDKATIDQSLSILSEIQNPTPDILLVIHHFQ
jgi:hypothetical protein